ASLVLWSWGDTSAPAPNRDGLRRLGRRLAAYNQYEPQQADELYPTDGTTDDSIYGLLGVPAYTFETDDTDGFFFQECGGPQGFETLTVQKNIDALRYAARALHAPYRLPGGPDVRNLSASEVTRGNDGWQVTVGATIDDTRYRQSNGMEPTYAIVAADAWIDGKPWQAAIDASPLAAIDGAFDSTTEQVSATITLPALAPGRHLLYVQGRNARGGGTGTAGTPSAVFIVVPEIGDDTIFENGFDTPKAH
ncbi:MAG TPA: M14 family zinc carboxypeptidase, partial [Dokdonella sp.]